MDFTGNGRLDILTGSIGGQVYLFRRKPNGTYAAGETVRLSNGSPIEVGRSSAVAAADWYGNGKLTLIIGNGDGTVYLTRNQGSKAQPAFGPLERLRAAGQVIFADGGSAGPCIADWDGDGVLDLILGSATGKVVWYRNIGTRDQPQLAAPVTLIEGVTRDAISSRNQTDPLQRSGPFSKVCVVDWNGDGRPDLVVGDYTYTEPREVHGWVWVYLRTSTITASERKSGAEQTRN